MKISFSRKFLILFFVELFCFTTLFAQDVKFKHLTIDNGLSQNTINTIIQDHKGVIWIGTWDGLNKYDGYDFVVYRNDGRNPNSLSDNRINALLEDKKHAIWVGTSAGLSLFDRNNEKFKLYPSPSKTAYVVFSIVVDSKGNLWVGTDEGLKFLNPLIGKLINIPIHQEKEKDKRIQSLYIDKNDHLWIGKFAGLSLYDIKRRKPVVLYPELQNVLKKSWIRAIKCQKDGSYWLATEADGVLHFKNHKQINYYTDKSGLLANTVRDILIVNDQEVWIGTKFGLSILNPKVGKIKNYSYNQGYGAQNSLSQSSIRSLFEDRKGNIWLGTYSGGINLVYNFKENFIYKGHGVADPSKLSNKEVNGILEDQEQNVWLATDGGGLNYWNRKLNSISIYKYLADYSIFNTIKTIHQDLKNKNILWLGTGGGVLKFDKKSYIFEQFKFTNTLNPPAFIQGFVFENSKEGLWIGTNFEGLFLFKDGKRIKSYDSKALLKVNNITALKEDKGKGLWIGSRASGLNYLNYKTGEVASYVFDKNKTNSLSSNNVLCLFQDSKGRLWIGTDGGGLNYYDEISNRFLTLDKKNGLLNNTIHAITEDSEGALWLSTNKGLFKVNTKISLNPLKFNNLEIVNYTVEDGLQSNQFLHHSVFRGVNDELFFGGINGLSGRSCRNVDPKPRRFY